MEQRPELFGLAERDEAAEGSLTVRRRRVEQNAGHRLVANGGVDPLPNGGGGVPALEGQLADQRVGEGVEQDVSLGGPPGLRVEFATLSPQAVSGTQALVALGVAIPLLPISDRSLREPQEDPFAADLA